MSDYHHTHWFTFYKCLVFSAPMSVAVNCFTFDALSQLFLDYPQMMPTSSSALVIVLYAVPLFIVSNNVW
jgi:hypothetical protein